MFVTMMHKKGLSTVIVSVLLVALSLIAVSLLWVYIGSLASKSEFSPAFSCLEMQLDPTVRLQRACYNNETGDLELRVFRENNDFNLRNIYFILNGEGDSEILCCGEGCESCDVLEGGKSEDYYFSGSGFDVGGNVLLRILNCGVEEREIEVCG